jgi:hypothetical protein
VTNLTSAAILGLAWFAAVNLVFSVIAAGLSYLLAEHVGGSTRRARLLLVLRFLPVCCATILSLALFVPAHLRLEPIEADERFGVILFALCAAAVGLFLRGGWRLAGLARAWRRLARATVLHGRSHCGEPWVELPMIHGIVLAGVFRPRVLIGAGVRETLTPGELAVAIAHELEHGRMRDNLVRVALACVPDFLALTPAARRIEALWEGEAECLADARAVGRSGVRAFRLASALVKVARLPVPAPSACHAGWSTLHRAALLETRVRLLVQPTRRPPLASGCGLGGVALLLASVIAGAWGVGAPAALHAVTEVLDRLRP